MAGWLALSSATALAQQAGWGLPALMQSMARVHSASASFTESKTLPMLTAPLLASGTLDYVAPDYIAKRTLAPVREDFILQQGEITLTGGPGNQTHRFSVARGSGNWRAGGRDTRDAGGGFAGAGADLHGDAFRFARRIGSLC